MIMAMSRVTVTLPTKLVEEIDRLESNRSRFVAEGVRREIERRRREALERSLRQPHQEAAEVAESGLAEWSDGLPDDDASDLLDRGAGESVRWSPGEGWAGEET